MTKQIKAVLPSKYPGGRTTLVFTDGSTRKLLPQVVAENALVPGRKLDDAALAALEADNGAASARQRAVRIISASSVSRQDLAQRLRQKGESPEDARSAVAWLEELHLLDDAETARQIVARGVSRGYGAERIKQMLYAKRIPKAYWEEALEELPDMSGPLEDFLRKRLGTEPDEKSLRSAMQAAIRRGYSWAEVRAALERIQNTDS